MVILEFYRDFYIQHKSHIKKSHNYQIIFYIVDLCQFININILTYHILKIVLFLKNKCSVYSQRYIKFGWIF